MKKVFIALVLIVIISNSLFSIIMNRDQEGGTILKPGELGYIPYEGTYYYVCACPDDAHTCDCKYAKPSGNANSGN